MIRFFGILLLLPFTTCLTKEKSVEGTFIRAINHEYAIGDDTLFIRALNKSVYQVEKRARFQRTIKERGRIPPIEIHNRTWTGFYDEARNIIREDKQGKILVFSQDKGLVLMGSLEYKRAK
jgi:hypothetical protein